MFFEQASEFGWPKIDIPDASIDFFEADILASTGNRDVDPLGVPANPTVGADVAHLEAIGIFEGRQLVRHLAGGGLVDRPRRLLVQGLMRALVIELLAEAIELALLGREAAGRRLGGFGLQGEGQEGQA